MRCFLNVASLLQSRMSIGNEFQADGAETAKALSVNRRRIRGVMKSPLDLERSHHHRRRRRRRRRRRHHHHHHHIFQGLARLSKLLISSCTYSESIPSF